MDFAEVASEKGFSGAVGIYCNGEPLLEFASGDADRSNGRPNTPNTRFGIASGTKGFTALTILRLIDQGKLALDTRVAELFSGASWIDPLATIEELLSHRSGVFDYFDEELIEDFDSFTVSVPWFRLEKPADYLPLFSGESPKFQRGERYSYSNGGYVILARVAEICGGAAFPDLVASEVLAVAGTERSGFFRFDRLPDGCASGYIDLESGGWKTNIYQLPVVGSGDGGMYATVRDLDHVWTALFGDNLLTTSLRERMLRQISTINEKFGYGLGVYIDHRFSTTAFTFIGSDAGVGFESICLPAIGVTATIVSNESDGQERVFDEFLELVRSAVTPDAP